MSSTNAVGTGHDLRSGGKYSVRGWTAGAEGDRSASGDGTGRSGAVLASGSHVGSMLGLPLPLLSTALSSFLRSSRRPSSRGHQVFLGISEARSPLAPNWRGVQEDLRVHS